jgi:hypothetical protein
MIPIKNFKFCNQKLLKLSQIAPISYYEVAKNYPACCQQYYARAHEKTEEYVSRALRKPVTKIRSTTYHVLFSDAPLTGPNS